jgi:hypothetical protein
MIFIYNWILLAPCLYYYILITQFTTLKYMHNDFKENKKESEGSINLKGTLTTTDVVCVSVPVFSWTHLQAFILHILLLVLTKTVLKRIHVVPNIIIPSTLRNQK